MEKLLKTWQKPQLIVLAKSTPEESVLKHCKTQNPGFSFPGENNDVFHADCAGAPATFNCRNCQSRAVGGT